MLCIQLASSVIFFVSMAILAIFPLKYMIVLGAVLILLLLALKNKQRKAHRTGRRQGSGKGAAFVMSAILLCFSFYALKVNAALDKIATGEESGGYEEEHALDLTGQPFNPKKWLNIYLHIFSLNDL